MRLNEVVGATRYSFQDKESKRQVEGVNVWFMQNADGENQVGKIPQKISLPIDSWVKVSVLPFPCACEAVVEQSFSSKGIKSKVTALEPIFSEKK